MSETHSAGDEHEIEYSVVAAKEEDGPRVSLPVIWETPAAQAGASGKRQHKPFVVTDPVDKAAPARACFSVGEEFPDVADTRIVAADDWLCAEQDSAAQ